MGVDVVKVEVEAEAGGDGFEIVVVVEGIWLGQCVNTLLLLAASLSSVFSFVHTLLLVRTTLKSCFIPTH